jgi:DNA ligase-associated metallophosphoesterase
MDQAMSSVEDGVRSESEDVVEIVHVTIGVGGDVLELHPDPAAFWRSGRELFVADLHLGKDAAFRAGAIPVPLGPTDATLVRLAGAIRRLSPMRVWILGDLVHSVRGIDASLRAKLDGFFGDHPEVEFKLVVGNHDRGIGDRLQGLRIEILEPPHRQGDFVLVHDAMTEIDDEGQDAKPESSQSGGTPLVIGGHVHPAISIVSGRERQTLPCFHLQQGRLTLAAMGRFTGCHRIERHAGDEVYAIAGQSVIQVHSAKRRSMWRSRGK